MQELMILLILSSSLLDYTQLIHTALTAWNPCCKRSSRFGCLGVHSSVCCCVLALGVNAMDARTVLRDVLQASESSSAPHCSDDTYLSW